MEFKAKQKEYFKEWYIKNKEKKKEYYEKNKEKMKENNKKYRKTDAGKKTNTISHWKSYGVKHDNFNELYEIYINTTNCDVCFKEFENSYDRTLDHDHNTGEFRMILCRGCNNHDSFEKKIFI